MLSCYIKEIFHTNNNVFFFLLDITCITHGIFRLKGNIWTYTDDYGQRASSSLAPCYSNTTVYLLWLLYNSVADQAVTEMLIFIQTTAPKHNTRSLKCSSYEVDVGLSLSRGSHDVTIVVLASHFRNLAQGEWITVQINETYTQTVKNWSSIIQMYSLLEKACTRTPFKAPWIVSSNMTAILNTA